jgi:hypothetical protein
MKKIFVALLSLLACIACYANPGYISTISIDELEHFTPKTTYLCSDNSIVILCDASYMDWEGWWTYGALIIKLDPQGNLLWQREPYFFRDENTRANEAEQTSVHSRWDDYDHIIGTGIDSDDRVHFIRYVPQQYSTGSIDTNGTVITNEPKSFAVWHSYFSKAMRLPNGEILACGRISKTSAAVYHAAFFRMSALGDSLAANYYPTDPGYSVNSTTGRGLVQKDDNSVYIACSLGSDDLSILHADLDGTIQSRYDISGYDRSRGLSMFCNSDSLMVFRIDENQSTILSTIDAVGNIHSYNIGSDLFHICSVAFGADHFVLLGGGHQYENAILAKYDYSLENNWIVDYDDISVYWDYSSPKRNLDILKIDSEACIYFVGTAYHSDIVVAKLLPNGQVPNLDEVQVVASAPIIAYPNPAQSSVTIEREYSEHHKAAGSCIEIYNIKGQKVRSIPICKAATPSAQIVWDRLDNEGRRCPTGIYLLRDISNPQITKKITLIK